MTDATLRRDLYEKRINGVVFGGKRIAWSDGDRSMIKDFVYSVDAAALVRAKAATSVPGVAAPPAVAKSQPTDRNFMFRISREMVDRENDVIKIGGINLDSFKTNAPILDSHDASKLPIASSSLPTMSGDSMFAVAKFPPTGVSRNSDRIAGAIRAGLVRGCSIGFIPRSWKFSSDPARPMGIDFNSVDLIEWSVCAIPCCPGALLVGPVASDASASDAQRAARVQEARRLRRLAGIRD